MLHLQTSPVSHNVHCWCAVKVPSHNRKQVDPRLLPFNVAAGADAMSLTMRLYPSWMQLRCKCQVQQTNQLLLRSSSSSLIQHHVMVGWAPKVRAAAECAGHHVAPAEQLKPISPSCTEQCENSAEHNCPITTPFKVPFSSGEDRITASLGQTRATCSHADHSSLWQAGYAAMLLKVTQTADLIHYGSSFSPVPLCSLEEKCMALPMPRGLRAVFLPLGSILHTLCHTVQMYQQI